MKKIVKKRPYISALILIILIIGVYQFTKKSEVVNTGTAKAVIGSVVQEVSVTGKVKPSLSADLSFEKSGKVAGVFVHVGDRVVTGQQLVSLSNGDVSAGLSQANAQVKVEEAKLEELQRGTRKEDIQVKQAELNKSINDLSNYYNNVKNTVEDAYVTADDATRIKTAGIFSGYKTSVYQFTFTTCSYNEESDARNLRLKSESILDNWKIEINKITPESPRDELDKALINAQSNLDVTRTLLQKINDTLVTGCTISDTSLSSYRTNVSTARAAVVSTAQSIESLVQSIDSQKLTIQKIQSELDFKLAGSSKEQIESQEATLLYAKARVESAEAELSKTIIRAPFSGLISKQDAKIGENISMSVNVVSLLADSAFEIEAYLPEADLTKVKIGDASRVTLDAYGSDEHFDAKVSFINPGETVIEGVPTYKTTFHFVQNDPRIKSGMTANIDVETARRDNVITIPQRFVITKDFNKFVQIKKDNVVIEVAVKTGLKGSRGDIEILSGINEGDEIVQY